MAKRQAARPQSSKRRSTHPIVDPSVVAEPSADAKRLALKLDGLLSAGRLKRKPFETLQSQMMGGTVRGWPGGGTHLFPSRIPGLTWPDTLYVPGDQRSVGLPRPPADHLYSDAWTDRRASKADATTGAAFAFAQALTTEPSSVGEAGIGIRFSPSNTLCNVRFEPEVNVAVSYRTLVNFWPQLIAGRVRVQGWFIAAAWKRNPVLGGSFELIHQNAMPVFDTGSQDAFDVPSGLNMFQRSLTGSALATTFLLEGGRTYVLGIVPWVKVEHNVTTNYGKVLPQDATKFRLWAQMACSVPYMSAYVQVLVP